MHKLYLPVFLMITLSTTQRAAAQTYDDLELPANQVIATPDDIGTHAVAIPDADDDGITDYLVGLPDVLSGAGALVIVPGPIPTSGRTVHDVFRVYLPPLPLPGFTMTHLGGGLVGGCDLNGDGREELWVSCQIAGTDGVAKHSMIQFDTTTLRVTCIAGNMPGDISDWMQAWNSANLSCHAAYSHIMQEYFVFNLNTPSHWGEYCPICGGNPAIDARVAASGRLVSSSNYSASAAKSAVEVLQWNLRTNMTREQTARAVAIAAMAHTYGRVIGAQHGEGMGNAARHGLWQMLTTRELGAEIARQIGDIHEEGQTAGLSIQRDSWVDLYNNARARELAAQCIEDGSCTAEELMARLTSALNDGTFITHPLCDERVPAHLRDCDGDGNPDGVECARPPGALPVIGPRLDINGFIARKTDVNGDSVVDLADVDDVLEDIGNTDESKDQNGDCIIWIDDAAAVLEEVDS